MVYYLRIFLWMMPVCLVGQINYNTNDLAVCIIENGLHYLNTPYQAGTLDQDPTEKLVCISDKFDCVTFVEYVLALSIYQTQNNGKDSKSFESILTSIRYRDGVISGYGSRLHYFTEWISQQQVRGHLQDISQTLGGVKAQKVINYMSRNAKKYPNIKSSNDSQSIKDAEKMINSTVRYYIPKQDVYKVDSLLQAGDIIAITTTIDGLDVSHTGFAIRVGEKIHLLHASEKNKKVEITEKSLYQYLMNNAKQSGIIVMRPK